MVAKRHKRAYARKAALQALYSSEVMGIDPDTLLAEGLHNIDAQELDEYAIMLLKGTYEHLAELDESLDAVSRNWAIARMSMVDRCILRIASFEMKYVEDVPISVSINEAVELAKEFGGEDDSHRFVNGILGKIALDLQGEECEA